MNKSEGRIRLGDALPLAMELVAFLKGLPGVVQAEYCGSLRRGKETIGDIDITVAAKVEDAGRITDAVTRHGFTAEVIQTGVSKTSIRTGNGVQVDVRIVPPESWGAAMQYFTGSQAHNVRLREIAVKKGLKVNEWGVFRVGNAKLKTQNAKFWVRVVVGRKGSCLRGSGWRGRRRLRCMRRWGCAGFRRS